jgi:hypothetical protein
LFKIPSQIAHRKLVYPLTGFTLGDTVSVGSLTWAARVTEMDARWWPCRFGHKKRNTNPLLDPRFNASKRCHLPPTAAICCHLAFFVFRA